MFDDEAGLRNRVDENEGCELLEQKQITPTQNTLIDQNVGTTSTVSLTPDSADRPETSSKVEIWNEEEDGSDVEVPDFLFSTKSIDPPRRIRKDHPTTQIIGEASKKIQTRQKPPVSYKDLVR